MGWLIPRLLAGVLAVAMGSLLGMLIGGVLQWPVLGAALGASTGALIYGFVDAWRAHRFMGWLRRQNEGSAPRDAGFWGEVGYRVERSVRLLEKRVEGENMRLTQFLSAIEASPNGVLLLDENDQIEWCNSVAADHFGLDPQRDRRQRITNLVRAPAFVAYLQSGDYDEAMSFGGPGARGTISVLIRPYSEGMKLVLSQDITERERNDAMRRDFVANVSHEIRSPLTVLSGFIETMGNLPLTEVERRRVLELMSQQTVRMQTLVGDLLTLAQLEGSPRPAADRWVSLQKVLGQVHADAEALSSGRHTLGFDQADGVQVAGAEPELMSAIANLVNNAVRYTPSGGRIDVRWSLRADGGGEIDVVDTGIGIEREHLPRLTERFYRVDGSRSRDTGGTGLGLSIVKHVAQRHGGVLEIDSEPGKGSTFKLMFPAARIRYIEPAVDPRRALDHADAG
ncbi:phosphate regulon sensor histidine kinase PhoR [Piscinibacter terrae]|uniref:Phosphate regulon sensor protein PhoR n=1 Tax=Piscinibacter terrae TaxID=2496871 RepID=A0A3N7HKK9_9BURK|nr:phosphate regulon sensor histidine kinase PhoR [Albitalea terrae]RQP22063.1 phosphate regulon sensor histidine kinase PhoR [Albitalea terrae]